MNARRVALLLIVSLAALAAVSAAAWLLIDRDAAPPESAELRTSAPGVATPPPTAFPTAQRAPARIPCLVTPFQASRGALGRPTLTAVPSCHGRPGTATTPVHNAPCAASRDGRRTPAPTRRMRSRGTTPSPRFPTPPLKRGSITAGARPAPHDAIPPPGTPDAVPRPPPYRVAPAVRRRRTPDPTAPRLPMAPSTMRPGPPAAWAARAARGVGGVPGRAPHARPPTRRIRSRGTAPIPRVARHRCSGAPSRRQPAPPPRDAIPPSRAAQLQPTAHSPTLTRPTACSRTSRPARQPSSSGNALDEPLPPPSPQVELAALPRRVRGPPARM